MKNRLLMFFLGVVIVVGLFVFTQNKNEKVVIQKKEAMESSVPLPRKEDIIRVFFNLIDEGRVADAVMMMASEVIEDQDSKEAWGVQLNAFQEIKVKSIVADSENIYKVVLETTMKPGLENINPIPNYGYGNGEYTRWVKVVKENDKWKILDIATGP